MSKIISGVSSTTYYDGEYEEHIKGSETRKLYYIVGGDGLCAIYEIKNGTGKMHYVLTDHLGSYDKIYDDNSALTEEYSFDAWGRRRNPTNWTYSGTWTYNFTSRGFTGHEHLDGFDVINMNGRCYDPNIGRFLSPDNYVQMPDFTQSFNRYAYCLNNPLIYADPSGEFSWLVVLAYAYFGGVMANVNHCAEGEELSNPFNPGNWDWSSPSTYFGIASGGLLGYGMSLEHCEYLYDMNTHKYELYSHLGDGQYNFTHYGTWVDNHSAFSVLYSTTQVVPFGGVDNIRNWTNTLFLANSFRYVIEIKRIAESPKATVSKFTAYGPVPLKPVEGYILEPGGPSTTVRNQDKRIPEDIYEVEPYSSTKHPNVYRVSNSQVPSDRSILIHTGNYHSHTLGCLLPGSSYSTVSGNYAVWNSTNKLNELRGLLGTNKATLNILDIPF